jgi:hypothetical protein
MVEQYLESTQQDTHNDDLLDGHSTSASGPPAALPSPGLNPIALKQVYNGFTLNGMTLKGEHHVRVGTNQATITRPPS